MDRNFYSYISAQKKYIEEFEKNELEDLVNKKAEQLKIPSEAVKSFLSFYHCKDFEESVQVIEKHFIDVIKKDNEIILNINNYNGMENVEIHYNLGSNKITVNIDEYTGDCKDFILERDEYLKSNYFVSNVSVRYVLECSRGANTVKIPFSDEKADGEVKNQSSDKDEESNHVEYVNDTVRGQTSGFNNMLRANAEKLGR